MTYLRNSKCFSQWRRHASYGALGPSSQQILATPLVSVYTEVKSVAGCCLTAPVTKDVLAAKTDSAVWAARIVSILDNLSHVDDLAAQLKEQLRTDEITRQSYDNFYSECLGICLPCFKTQVQSGPIKS